MIRMCKKCGREERIYAKGLCASCYQVQHSKNNPKIKEYVKRWREKHPEYWKDYYNALKAQKSSKDEIVTYNGIIEQIETGKGYDILDLCNRKRNLWVLSVFSGYRQIGQFKVSKPHEFNEGDLVVVELCEEKVVGVKKDSITISNINQVFKD